ILRECEERTSKGTETKHGKSSVPFLILNLQSKAFPLFAICLLRLGLPWLARYEEKHKEKHKEKDTRKEGESWGYDEFPQLSAFLHHVFFSAISAVVLVLSIGGSGCSRFIAASPPYLLGSPSPRLVGSSGQI
ncbi:MAG: hypothetical protein WCA35_20690, partial [Kovacikia sp.]